MPVVASQIAVNNIIKVNLIEIGFFLKLKQLELLNNNFIIIFLFTCL